MNCIFEFLKSNKNTIVSIIPSLCTIIVAIISSLAVVHSARKNQREEAARALCDDLKEFYYPFLLLAKKTTQLYAALNDITQISEDGCINYLLSGQKFSGNAKALFEQILNNDIQLNNLILENSNVVSNDDLRQKLANLSAHYTILELAYNGELSKDETALSKYSFPSQVIDLIEKEIICIKNRIVHLNSLYK